MFVNMSQRRFIILQFVDQIVGLIVRAFVEISRHNPQIHGYVEKCISTQINLLSGKPRLEDEEVRVDSEYHKYLVDILGYHTLLKVDNPVNNHHHELYQQDYLKLF